METIYLGKCFLTNWREGIGGDEARLAIGRETKEQESGQDKKGVAHDIDFLY